MAFVVDAIVPNVEFRGMESGTNAKGVPYRTLRFEDFGGRNFEVFCNVQDLFPQLDVLHKGDLLSLECRIGARRSQFGGERGFISLQGIDGYKLQG